MTSSDLISRYINAQGNSAQANIPVAVGVPVTQLQTLTISKVGVTSGANYTAPAVSSSTLNGTQSASVTNPNFTKPQIYRTNPTLVQPMPGIYAAFRGYYSQIANTFLKWYSTTPVQTVTNRKAVPGTGLGISGLYDAYAGITNEWSSNIGNRMIPDAAQSFNWFAGGLNRGLKGIAPQNVLDWSKGQTTKAGQNIYTVVTPYLANALPWSDSFSTNISPGWNRNILGQGFGAFQGFATNTAGQVPLKTPPSQQFKGVFSAWGVS